MPIRVLQTDLRVLDMRTRMVLRYGIAALSGLPHLFVRALLEFDGVQQWGIAADGLPPKWFTKDPTTTFAADLRDMVEVIESACRIATEVGESKDVFGWWSEAYADQL